MTGDEQRFYEGDVITARGNEYTVETVDITVDGDVLQHRLDGRDGSPQATLSPVEDGYVIKEYHPVDGEDITVIE